MISFGKTALADTRVIIPTYNAERYLADFLPALSSQGLSREQILVVDSSSTDRTVERFRDFGAQIHIIPTAEFDHGGTRRLAAALSREAKFLIFLTQDAIPASAESFVKLLDVFEQPQVGMAYGRQLPRLAAAAIERHARLVNYPAHASELRSLADCPRLGVKTIFCSDSFAAYRREALDAVGSFPERVFFAEDQIVAATMLDAGWSLAYCAEAEVVHSHGYTIKQDFKRYFDVGVFHARNAWLLKRFGRAEGAGLDFIRSEFRYLCTHEPWSIPSAFLRTLAKYLGYRLGRIEARLPITQKARLSMSPQFFLKETPACQVKG